MKCPLPPENAHRTSFSRASDLSGYADAPVAARLIPVGDSEPSHADGDGTTGSGTHPFGGNAVRLHDLGLVVFPCGGPDGKKPLVKGWHLRKSCKTIATWAQRFRHREHRCRLWRVGRCRCRRGQA